METIKQLREEIEKVDTEIIEKIVKRRSLAKKIGELKANSGINVLDLSREQHLMQLYEKLCQEHQLNTNTIKEIFRLIIADCRSVQKKD
jgi:chorismate mutase